MHGGDHLDRPVKMTDDSQAVVWDAFYTAYGEARTITGATNNLRFPGQYFLAESGLHYNWHRHYDPTLGRYLQPDPIRDVIATQPVNLDGSTLTSRRGGAQFASSAVSPGGPRSRIGAELPEFTDGASIYQYARSAPTVNVDPDGLAVAAVVRAVSYCATHPLLCATTIKAGVDACLAVFNNASRPPPGSRGINETPWSGDHKAIKDAIRAGAPDNVKISPDGDVWRENPDGSWTNHGPAESFTGSGKPSGRRGKDRDGR